jgi:hypothetical protein
VLVGYAAWCLFFLVHRSRGSGFAWVDVAVIFVLPLLILTTRLLMRGVSEDTARLPFAYAQGMSAAALGIASVWVVWGRTPWTLRILPFGITIAIVIAMIVICLRDQPAIVWAAIASVTAPAALAIVVLGVMRLAGLRLGRAETRRPSSAKSTNETRKRTQWPIRDLFLITAVASFVLAVARPVLPQIGEVANVAYLQWPLFAVVVLFAVIPLLAFSRRRSVSLASQSLAGLLVAWLIAEPTLEFIGYGTSGRWLSLSPEIRVQMVFAVAMFIGLLPYRLRGWRVFTTRSFAKP